MGRITIFSLMECPHCKRTKGALANRNIPYVDINLSYYPSKRNDMLALSDRLTVPQVFFNETHIGGAEDTIKLLERWDAEKKYDTAAARYIKEIASVADPTDPRLEVPTGPPVQEAPPPPRNHDEDDIPVPNGDATTKKMTVLALTKLLMERMPKVDLPYRGTFYKNSFRGSMGTAALKEIFKLKDNEEAVAFGKLLQKRQILDHVTADHRFDDTDQYYFRLQAYATPNIINSLRIWTDRVDPNPEALVVRLKSMLGKVESKYTDSKGNMDYLAASKDEQFDVFDEAICEIQKVEFARMEDNQKLAFGINLYNLMIKHAFIKVGIPTKNIQRASFFDTVSYNIGGDVLSFSELENGVLRANSRAPYHLGLPFPTGDRRRRLALDRVDCRIHFALNCGAKSCPPVKKFSSQAIDEELRIVAQAFCEQEENVGVDEEKQELYLSTIFHWYQPDFAESKAGLAEKVVGFLRGEKKAALQWMVSRNDKKIKIQYNHYDWGTNAKESKIYAGSEIRGDEKSVKALFNF
mmetsp:Transcript_8913/g.13798  ORF Transcript_8913/g.13798 Transcript_8913/m.13798 type:complete len:523 (+) Transcript_8913:121-1689(+)